MRTSSKNNQSRHNAIASTIWMQFRDNYGRVRTEIYDLNGSTWDGAFSTCPFFDDEGKKRMAKDSSKGVAESARFALNTDINLVLGGQAKILDARIVTRKYQGDILVVDRERRLNIDHSTITDDGNTTCEDLEALRLLGLGRKKLTETGKIVN